MGEASWLPDPLGVHELRYWTGTAFGAAPPAGPPPPASPQTDRVEQLRTLGELRDAGILTEEEFAGQKARILGG